MPAVARSANRPMRDGRWPASPDPRSPRAPAIRGSRPDAPTAATRPYGRFAHGGRHQDVVCAPRFPPAARRANPRTRAADGDCRSYGIRIAAGAGKRVTGNRIVGRNVAKHTDIFANATDACYDNHIRSPQPTRSCDATLRNL